uniref:Ras-specific guanine nucleotide-releasing factor RalGPS1 n=1 Tax=Phallusia mammillata TaxID=59560 RepID=A0A6F9DQV3_9ASCI|nr:ras-specific guanine nucleotide-releasing factor RalGPS1 [Phallusia mammillata]
MKLCCNFYSCNTSFDLNMSVNLSFCASEEDFTARSVHQQTAVNVILAKALPDEYHSSNPSTSRLKQNTRSQRRCSEGNISIGDLRQAVRTLNALSHVHQSGTCSQFTSPQISSAKHKALTAPCSSAGPASPSVLKSSNYYNTVESSSPSSAKFPDSHIKVVLKVPSSEEVDQIDCAPQLNCENYNCAIEQSLLHQSGINKSKDEKKGSVIPGPVNGVKLSSRNHSVPNNILENSLSYPIEKSRSLPRHFHPPSEVDTVSTRQRRIASVSTVAGKANQKHLNPSTSSDIRETTNSTDIHRSKSLVSKSSPFSRKRSPTLCRRISPYKELSLNNSSSSSESENFQTSEVVSHLPPKSPAVKQDSAEADLQGKGRKHTKSQPKSLVYQNSSRKPKNSISWKPTHEMMTNHQYEGHYRDESSEEGGSCEVDGTGRVPRMKSFDAVVFDVLRVSPEEFARQLTILDFPIFCAIRPEELSSCGWTKKAKWKISPNVCAMTQRFNHTSFWVIREILNAGSLKGRAEVLTHFIKIAKKLLELSNLHSLMAVVQSLNSASIFRLTKTWALINKHHKSTFDRLLTLVKEDDNRWELRSHMEAIKLPCIPFLGMYLADVMYINSAHPDTGGLESHERTNKMNNILRVISEFQQSKYDHLQEQPHIKNYLNSVKYIEELQKFLEEDNYKLSLKIEPTQAHATPERKTAKTKDDLLTGKTPHKVDHVLNRHVCQTPPAQQRFVPGHRKSRSLGKEFAFSSGSASRPKSENSKIHKSGSLPRAPLPATTPMSVTTSLLDDSIIAMPSSLASSSSSNTRMSVTGGNNSSIGSSRSNSGSEFSEHDDMSWSSERPSDMSMEFQTCNFEGVLRRKCVAKHGRKPAMSPWTKYWVCLCGTQLVYYSAKSLRAQERHNFKARPTKAVSIKNWMLLETHDTNSFQLSNPDSGNMYRFQCDSRDVTRVWILNLKEAVKGYPQPEKDLINLEDI